MKSNMQTKMEVRDVFRFSDGRTVFVGSYNGDGDGKLIRPTSAVLVVEARGGKNGRQTSMTIPIVLEGEMIPSPLSLANRAVSTTDSVPVDLHPNDIIVIYFK